MKLRFKLSYVVWFVILVWLGNSLIFPAPASEKIADSNLKALIDGNNSFCFDLYHKLKEKEGNIFFSPYSMSTALAMTYAGARGVTEKEMAQVLHFTLPREKLHPAFAGLAAYMENIQAKGNIKLSIANALWIQKNFKLKKNFLGITDKFYGAAPFPVNFIPPDEREKSRQKINRWVEDKTKEKIKNLIPKGILTSLTRLVLTNAIYFKGDWAARFNESDTKDAPFRVSPGKKVTVPMMYVESSFKYMADGRVQVLQLPYKGKETSMLVILPGTETGIKKLESELNNARLKEWSNMLRQRKVRVYLPKFKMTCKYEMKKILVAMGMADAFSDSANFSAMADEPLLIDEVLHKAFVEVNEEGTEAAAATAVVMSKRGPPREIPPVFRADHPFIFLIQDNESGSFLFMGRISDPS